MNSRMTETRDRLRHFSRVSPGVAMFLMVSELYSRTWRRGHAS